MPPGLHQVTLSLRVKHASLLAACTTSPIESLRIAGCDQKELSSAKGLALESREKLHLVAIASMALLVSGWSHSRQNSAGGTFEADEGNWVSLARICLSARDAMAASSGLRREPSRSGAGLMSPIHTSFPARQNGARACPCPPMGSKSTLHRSPLRASWTNCS
jgi:hypothetical protein